MESFLSSDAAQLVQNANGFQMNSRKTPFRYIRRETTIWMFRFSSSRHMTEPLFVGLACFHSKIFMKWLKLSIPKFFCKAYLISTIASDPNRDPRDQLGWRRLLRSGIQSLRFAGAHLVGCVARCGQKSSRYCRAFCCDRTSRRSQQPPESQLA